MSKEAAETALRFISTFPCFLLVSAISGLVAAMAHVTIVDAQFRHFGYRGETRMRARFDIFALVAFGLTFALTSAVHAEDWPAFRGPTGDGNSAGTGFPTTWSTDENVKWKVALESVSSSSPIVSNGRVFLNSANEDGTKRSLHCYDRADGSELWVKTVVAPEAKTHPTNLFSGSTPVADGERVVVWHSSAGLFCYDFAGEEIWNRQLGQFVHQYGYGGSPIIHEGNIILFCGPGEKAFLTSIDLKSGKTNWTAEEPQPGDGMGQKREDGKDLGTWSTPLITEIDGATQVVFAMASRVNGYDLASGKILWSFGAFTGGRYGDCVAATPVVGNGFCFATGWKGGPAVGFKLGGTGDITESAKLWDESRPSEVVGTGVFVDGFFYRPMSKRGAVDCVDPATGDSKWKSSAPRYGFWGSLVYADGLIYGTDTKGVTFVFKATSESYEEVAQNDLGEASNSTPAFSNKQIFIRTEGFLYCIGE